VEVDLAISAECDFSLMLFGNLLGGSMEFFGYAYCEIKFPGMTVISVAIKSTIAARRGSDFARASTDRLTRPTRRGLFIAFRKLFAGGIRI
jgi:hypothetical protein